MEVNGVNHDAGIFSYGFMCVCVWLYFMCPMNSKNK